MLDMAVQDIQVVEEYILDGSSQKFQNWNELDPIHRVELAAMGEGAKGFYIDENDRGREKFNNVPSKA